MADSIDDLIANWARKKPGPKSKIQISVEEPPVSNPVEEIEVPKPIISNPPKILPCGHIDWFSKLPRPTEDGLCCEGKRHDHGVFWTVRGLIKPVPKQMRRSKEERIGFPGLCCDPKTGLYIGGIGNDCRYYHPNPLAERCEEHTVVQPRSKKTRKDPAEDKPAEVRSDQDDG